MLVELFLFKDPDDDILVSEHLAPRFDKGMIIHVSAAEVLEIVADHPNEPVVEAEDSSAIGSALDVFVLDAPLQIGRAQVMVLPSQIDDDSIVGGRKPVAEELDAVRVLDEDVRRERLVAPDDARGSLFLAAPVQLLKSALQVFLLPESIFVRV